MRSFAKEAACCERYEVAQGKTLKWGLKSAVAGSFFFGFNYIAATGALVVIIWNKFPPPHFLVFLVLLFTKA